MGGWGWGAAVDSGQGGLCAGKGGAGAAAERRGPAFAGGAALRAVGGAEGAAQR